MNRHPLETIQNLDPQFFEKITQYRNFTFQDGALPAKTKYLVAMALDAVHGATAGVTSLARQAMQHGATKEEIMETLHVAGYIDGAGCIYTASAGLSEVFK